MFKYIIAALICGFAVHGLSIMVRVYKSNREITEKVAYLIILGAVAVFELWVAFAMATGYLL